VLKNLLIVGLGGFTGSVLRYLLGGAVHQWLRNPWFPYGTLAVNLLGCFFIGLLGGWSDNLDLLAPATRLFLLIGLLGGFTTFSTFGYETLALLRDREVTAALLNIALQLLVGLTAVWLGYMLSTVRGG